MATKRGRGEGDVKKKMARLRFKNLVRSVTLNRIWLMDSGEQKLSLNVKKNINMLIRPQRKVGILTMAEKTLLRTHHYLRSINDRKKLVNLLASLTCFSRIPPKVRARLTPVIKLCFVGPGRKIIKEGDPPSTVYFILSGEVELYKRVFDRTKHTYVDKLESISGPGDCLGDIEMIEDCERLNTYISRNQVELLVLHEDDFNTILRPTMAKQWMERKAAVSSLEYFKYLNHDQIITACKLGLIRQFDPLETIYYEDKGHISYVHFVISGECMILQCLKMKVTTKAGGKSFELFDISQNEGDNLLFQDSTLNISKDGIFRNISSFFDVNYEIMSEEEDKNKKGSRLFQKMDIKSIEVSCGLKGTSEEEITSGKDSRFSKEYLNGSEDAEYLSEFSDFFYTQGQSVETLQEHLFSAESKTGMDKQRISNIHSKENISPGNNFGRSSGNSNYFNNVNSNVEPDEMSSTKKESNTKIENHFIDVGSITFGGIFSLGEKLEHRVIMARTTVQCLMLPRYWLMERDQNPGNIWQRRRFYLDSTIPSREQLFKDFLTTRTWQKFKNSIISSNLTRYLGNPTKVQDIPIICRIVEPSED
uniref:cAMP-dependent protein kinase regulatory subunit n=1 Tax=Bactrocera dorsalis TaxID=27457 RepID=A0A034WRV2_BACDO